MFISYLKNLHNIHAVQSTKISCINITDIYAIFDTNNQKLFLKFIAQLRFVYHYAAPFF